MMKKGEKVTSIQGFCEFEAFKNVGDKQIRSRLFLRVSKTFTSRSWGKERDERVNTQGSICVHTHLYRICTESWEGTPCALSMPWPLKIETSRVNFAGCL